MAPQITPKQRELIVKLRKAGYPISEIQRETGITKKTISFWLKRKEETGRLIAYHRKNYKRTTTAEQDAAIIAAHKAQPLLNTQITALQYNISTDTVRRRLQESGLRNRVTKTRKKSRGASSTQLKSKAKPSRRLKRSTRDSTSTSSFTNSDDTEPEDNCDQSSVFIPKIEPNADSDLQEPLYTQTDIRHTPKKEKCTKRPAFTTHSANSKISSEIDEKYNTVMVKVEPYNLEVNFNEIPNSAIKLEPPDCNE